MFRRNLTFLSTLPLNTQFLQYSRRSEEPIYEQLSLKHSPTAYQQHSTRTEKPISKPLQLKYSSVSYQQFKHKCHQFLSTMQNSKRNYSLESYMFFFYMFYVTLLYIYDKKQQYEYEDQAKFAQKMFEIISRDDKSFFDEEKHEIKKYFKQLSADDKYNYLNNAYSYCLDTSSFAVLEYTKNRKTSLASIQFGEETSLLTFATYSHNYQAAMFLIELGADIARVDPHLNNTLLHYLCNNKDTTAEHKQLVTLIMSKLDEKMKIPYLSYQNKEGKTALDIATDNKNQDIIAILQNEQVNQPSLTNIFFSSIYQLTKDNFSLTR